MFCADMHGDATCLVTCDRTVERLTPCDDSDDSDDSDT
jgi:hypothetical protein